MSNVSQTDKQEPHVQTGQSKPEQTGQQQNNPGQSDPKKGVQNNQQNEQQNEQKKTGTR